jgi:hypothetical protein
MAGPFEQHFSAACRHMTSGTERGSPLNRFAIPWLLLFLWSVPAISAETRSFDPQAVHWAYSAYFGTGWYRVSNDRDAYVLRYTPRWDFQESSLNDDGQRTLGVHFRFPVSAGLDVFRFDDPGGTINADNLSTMTITPGVDIEVPISSRWALRPFATVGWGSVLDDSETAWIYWAGLKSRYLFHQAGERSWALLNAFGYVGYSPSNGPSDFFWPLMIGLEFDHPLGSLRFNGDRAFLNWHFTYTSFERDLEFVVGGVGTDAITDQWELALALGKQQQPLRLWFLSFDRLGLGYRVSTNGDLHGIVLVFRSVFDD